MGTVNTTLPRYPSIINQYSNNSFFIIDNVDGRGDYVINRDRDHDIDNGSFYEILGVAICLMIFR